MTGNLLQCRRFGIRFLGMVLLLPIIMAVSGCDWLAEAVFNGLINLALDPLPHSSTVRGRTLAPDGRSIGAVKVELQVHDDYWDENGHRYSVDIYTSATTDESGCFELHLSREDMEALKHLGSYPYYHLSFNAPAGYEPLEFYEHRVLSGDPDLGDFVLPFGS